MRKIFITTALSLVLATSGTAAKASYEKDVVKNYTAIVYANYFDSYNDGVKLKDAISEFLANPCDETLQAAKSAWLVSRDSYGQTEAFRFYEGPIDYVNDEEGTEGPEGQLNAWPLNEAYIDYVFGNDEAGIVQNGNVEITVESLKGKNQENDEADVSTGYHAIEFLLWGQDLTLDSAGDRPVSDYFDTPPNQRRRAYLKAVTELLVSDLAFLKDSWMPNKANYGREFSAQDEKVALGKILTALATLSGFELASERIATALDSGDQEDEHSCFSDNTHNDFIMNAKGVSNVFFGGYNDVTGASIYTLLKKKDANLAKQLTRQLLLTEKLIAKLPHPIDRELLATAAGSDARQTAEAVVTSLQKQANLFKKAGEVLGVEVQILE